MRGRKTKYFPEMCEQVEKLGMLGATDQEIADFLNIEESTLNDWKLKRPEFSESINKGKILADTNVAHSLYKRAIGWKNLPPDVAACIFWLKNRRKGNWRDKIDTGLIDIQGRQIIPKIIFVEAADCEPIREAEEVKSLPDGTGP